MTSLNFSSGSIVLVVLGWGMALLILWNLYRHAGAVGKRGFLVGALLTTVVAGGGVSFLAQQARPHLPKHRLLVVCPFLEKTATGHTLTPQGLAFAEALVTRLRLQHAAEFYPLPVEAIFEIANLDSLTVPEYLSHLAHAAGVQLFGVGMYAAHDSNQYEIQFQLYDALKAEPILQQRFAAQAAAFDVLSEKILSVLKVDRLPVQTAPSEPRAREYYALLLRFLHGEEVSSEAAALARSDTSDSRLATLSARATLRRLRARRTTDQEWQASLKTVLPSLQRALVRDSLQLETYLLLAQCYLQQKKWTDAEKMLRRARAREERHSKSYVYFAQLHASRYAPDGFANELELFQYALALNPFDLEAVAGAGEYLMLNNRRQEALTLLTKYRRINPKQLAVLKSLGRLYLIQVDMQKVLPLYEEIIRLDAKDANAFYNLGIAYYSQKDYDHAIKFFERALELNDHADARLYLAYIYEQRGDMDKSIAYLRERIRLSTGDDDAFAAEARKHLYALLLKRGEIPAHLQPDTSKKQ